MKDNTKLFCEELRERFPELESLLVEHVQDYDEILPHVFMADVTRYVLSDQPSRRGIVSYLNRAFREQGEDVQNVIAASFIENIEDEQMLDVATRDTDAEAIRKEWHRQRSA